MDGVTGRFFHEQTPESVAEVVARFDPGAFDPARIRRHAELFDVSVFKERVLSFVTDKHELHESRALLETDERFGILARVNEQGLSADGERAQKAVEEK